MGRGTHSTINALAFAVSIRDCPGPSAVAEVETIDRGKEAGGSKAKNRNPALFVAIILPMQRFDWRLRIFSLGGPPGWVAAGPVGARPRRTSLETVVVIKL